jgi:hypothetical protein
MKKILLLIISSSEQVKDEYFRSEAEVYNQFRNLSRLYHKKMKEIYKDNYNYYFIEYKETLDTDIEIIDDMIYMKGIELLNEALNKTTRAIEYLVNIIDFDLLIRTNLSSFWNIPFVFNYFDNYRNTELVTGVGCRDFITGTGIIMSKDIAEKISTIRDNSTPLEDLNLNNYLNNITHTERLPSNFMYFLIDGENNIFPENRDNIMYYRVKSENRIKYDIIAFKKLLSIVYNINVE